MRSATKRNLEPEAPEPAQPERQKGSVAQRVITSFIAIPIVLVFVWFGGWWAFAAAGLVVALGINELHTMMVHEGYHPLIVVSLVLSMLFMIAAMFPHLSLLFLEIGLVLALLVSFPLLFFRKKLDGAMVDWSLTIAIAVYLGWPLSLFPVLRGYQVGFSPGLWWVLTVLLGTWSFDSGAFFTGRLIGRHKLAPKISPAKTWEGVVGGLVCSIAFSLALTAIPLKVPWYLAIVLGILIGVAATLGDLAESLIKRTTHVKDSGHFMPGHGGILDRADSILFAIVVVFVFTQVIAYL
ncbi:MAG TPA: phosphatidate cytidylyltransferase [Ktedonobacteraceae bacterium]|nr:phosphatidate cytidylyltransferase [Ktedonobacteraceae bacterium]